MIYLDHNATTPIDERVLDAMLPFLTTFYGNPSSLYRPGRVVRSALETARGQVASLVGVQPAQVIFTSGGTEANNLALAAGNPDAGLAISAIEHPSIAEPAQRMAYAQIDHGIFRQVLLGELDAAFDIVGHQYLIISFLQRALEHIAKSLIIINKQQTRFINILSGHHYSPYLKGAA